MDAEVTPAPLVAALPPEELTLARAHALLAQVLQESNEIQRQQPAQIPNTMHSVGMAAGAGLAGAHVIMAISAAFGHPMDPGVAADIVTLAAIAGGWLIHRNFMRKLAQ